MKIYKLIFAGLIWGSSAVQIFGSLTISPIADQRTFPTLPTRPISFVIGDDQTSASSLVVTGVSSNLSLVANSNIVLGGSGSNRTVTITPSGIMGTNLITLSVQNSFGSNTTETFALTIAGFTDIGANLVPLDSASVAWGDYDNDGFLDLLVTGQNTNVPYASGGETARIYHNNGDGTFTDIGATNLSGIIGGDAKWGDYNNDGQLDILLAGMNNVGVMYQSGTAIYGATLFSAIYRNYGSNVFTQSSQLLSAGEDGMDITRAYAAAWGDYDNDGKLDAAFSGPYGQLLHNNGNDIFAGSANVSLGAPDSTSVFVDYNNDGYLDISYTPGSYYRSVPAPPGEMIQNQGNGTFQVLTNLLPTLSQGSVAWEDYNNDGVFDVAMVGNETNTILVGNGQGGFTNLPITLPGGGLSSVAWGDFDNDGLPDLVVASYSGTRILHNNGDGTFTDMGISLPAAGNGGVAVGDFNNDGCLDIALVGAGVTKIFRNDGAMPGFLPSAPSNLNFSLTTNLAILSWSPVVSSNQSGGFTYNLRVGSTPGGMDIVGPMANPATGQRRVPALGNAGLITNRTLTHLQAGTYYWSVQAINHAFVGSAFAPEQSITLVAPFIISQPLSQTNLIGATVTFAVTNGGTAPLFYQWYFNGNPLSDGGQFNGSASPSLSVSDIQNYNIGGYQVVVGNAMNTVTSVVAYLTVTNFTPSVRYVNLNSPNPTSPYLDWSTAATNIQDAIDVSFDGDTILVTNGIYSSGSRVVYGSLPNRVAINKAVTVQSVNGPAVTVIQGQQTARFTNGTSSVRCVYLTNNASLIGFTLTNGSTHNSIGDSIKEYSGGGVWCESTNVVVSNCVINGNSAANQGGGAYGGNLVNCSLVNNTGAFGGGESSSLLIGCTVETNAALAGGGVYLGVIENCLIAGNTALGGTTNVGGGTFFARVFNSVITGNASAYQGGGAFGGALVNCTITENSASNSFAGSISAGGGEALCNATNCIIYHNTAHANSANITNWLSGSLDHCCTTPLPGGTGNFTNEPVLATVSHLSINSPCIAAGNFAAVSGTDIDGEAWGNPPSIGCDQLYPGNAIGNISASIWTSFTNLAPGYFGTFTANNTGSINASSWNFGDGTVVSNQAYVLHTWSTPGDYPVVLTVYNDSYPNGQSTTLLMHIAVPTIYYVNLNSVNPIAPYSQWSTAATNIQDAVDVAVPGSLVLVTNGVPGLEFNTNAVGIYQFGGRAVYGLLSNRVAITKPLTVQSVNGPAVTIIQGSPTARCVYLTNGASLIGFTLTNGKAAGIGAPANEVSFGGGTWAESTNVIITNCIIQNCSAATGGGAAYSGALNNCLIRNNTQGAVYSAVLNNCTVIRNSGNNGGGAYASVLSNCTVAWNSVGSGTGGGVSSSILNNCTINSNSAASGFGGGAYVCTLNNCILSSNSATAGSGGGAYVCLLTNCTLSNNSANNSVNPGNGGAACGGVLQSCVLVGNLAYSGGAVYGGQGTSTVFLANCTISNNAASSGGGVYGVASPGDTNCTLVNCLISSNAASGNGGGAFAATLNSCTISSNIANAGGGVEGGVVANCVLVGNLSRNRGGGADGASSATVLNNCTLSSNVATNAGGGANSSVLSNCTLMGNLTVVGVPNTPLGGGGASFSTLYNCLVASNSAPGNPTYLASGGGTYACTANNCILAYNSAGTNGGGDADSTLTGCTVVGNSAPFGGGVAGSTVRDSIVYYNIGGNYCVAPFANLSLNYCCTTPGTNGSGNIMNEPAFASLAKGDFHLQSGSPCINSGANIFVSVASDFDGNPRIVGGTVDIGTYEYQTPSSVLSYAWAQQYGLPTDGTVDYLDLDGTGMNNWQKSVAGLNPTNAASVLVMLTPATDTNSGNVIVSWESVSNRTYYLQRATNLGVQPAFSAIQSNVVGSLTGTNTFTDPNSAGLGPYFYRVGVQW